MTENVKREIVIEKGAPKHLKIPFSAEGNQGLQGPRGDLVVVLVQAEHPLFERRNNDLLIRNVRVNLAQALCGFVYCLKHLDDRNICISTKPGEVIHPGDLKVVEGEGMPLRNNPFDRGDLLLQFVVDFPESGSIEPEQLLKLETLLPPREPFTMPADAEEVQLVEFQPRDDSDSQGCPHGRENEDYEVQCQTD